MRVSDIQRGRDGRVRRGAAALELALVLPVLVLLLVIAVDFCRVFHAYLTITSCARNGALWASDAVAQATSKYANVTAAALADAPNLSPTPTVSGPISGADANGNSYVDVTVTYEFQMMTSYLGFSSKSLARTVRMRVAPAVPN